jgi:ATP-binding cassette, subfamily B, bacterial
MAELIIVLDGARVVEFGTHEELIANGGTYADLYGIQASSYRAGYQTVDTAPEAR